MLEEAYKRGVLSDLEWRTYRELAQRRNSHTHFRRPGSPSSLLARVVQQNARPTEVLANDARRAVLAMARIVRRQSVRAGGNRVHPANSKQFYFTR